MRILILSEAYPPEPVVGAFRTRKLARAFRDGGHEVVVVVASAGVGAAIEEGIEVNVSAARRSPAERLRALAVRRTGTGNASSEGVLQAAPIKQPSIPGVLKRPIISLLNTPDDRQALIPALRAGAKGVMRQWKPDVIYASAPAYSVLIAAALTSRATSTPWIAELRDPWRSCGGERLACSSSLGDFIDARLEKWCLSGASALVTVTESAARELTARIGLKQRVVSAVNGIEEVHRARLPRAQDTGPLRVIYFGSLYPPRDPRPLVRALVRQARSIGNRPLEFVFIGDCRAYGNESMADFVRSAEISEAFHFINWLPQDEALRAISAADLLLLPAQKWVLQLPNKLFDYLGVRVPIFALADRSSETARILTEVGGHFVAHDEASLDEVARRALLAGPASVAAGDETVLQLLTVSAQFGRLVRQVEEIVSALRDRA